MTERPGYFDRYQSIAFSRSAAGVVEMRLHTRGGPALWGTSLTSLHAELGQAFLDIARDPANRVLVLTGTGDSFIAAMDREEGFHEPSLAHAWPRIYDEGIALLRNLLDVPFPIIAAVNGPALIHAELAVLSDIVLASETAVFADAAHMPGAVPGDGVHTVWTMVLGPNRGRYFLLTNEHIGAAEAKALGVVGEVLPAEQLLARAHALAAQLAQSSRETLRFSRSLLTHELRQKLNAQLGSGLAHEALAMLLPR